MCVCLCACVSVRICLPTHAYYGDETFTGGLVGPEEVRRPHFTSQTQIFQVLLRQNLP